MKKLILLTIIFIALTACSTNSKPKDTVEILPVNDIIEKVEASYENFVITSVKYDSESNKDIYEVEGHIDMLEYDITLNATTADIITVDNEREHDLEKELIKSDFDNINTLIQKASKDAGKAFGLNSWSLSYELNTLVLELDFENSKGKDLEYKYDAHTQTLLKKEQ